MQTVEICMECAAEPDQRDMGVTSVYCFTHHCGNFEFDTIVNSQTMTFT